MKNMKKLIALVAVFAMMLSMGTVAFATFIAIDPATENFAINIDSQDVLVGSTDTINVRLNFTVTSPVNAVDGLSVLDVSVLFDDTVLTIADPHDWTVSPDLSASKQMFATTTNGILRACYKTSVITDTIKTGSYYEIHFKLADGVAKGTKTTVSAAGNAVVNTYNNLGKPNLNWLTKDQVTSYTTAGTVSVVSDDPVVTAGPTEPNFGNADPKQNFITQWGSLTHLEKIDSSFEYGIVAFVGEGDFDVTTPGAVLYSALGNKDGLYGVKLLGDLVDAGIRVRTYMFDGTNYTYGN